MGVEESPRYKRKKRRRLKAQEERWRSLNGPVITYRVEDVRRGEDDSRRDDRSVEGTPE